MAPIISMEGQRFGMLEVLSFHHSNNGAYWLCRCDCGNERILSGGYLRRGHAISCGCHQKSKDTPKKHGQWKTRLYHVWGGMKYRCKSNKRQYAHIYSNKGIKVCEEWQDFEPFYEWAMNNGYSDALTIDRIDSDGDYCPENCRWVDMKVQSNNTSRNVYIEFEGECHTLAEWADIVGISYSGMANRYKRGWSVERMLTTPNGR